VVGAALEAERARQRPSRRRAVTRERAMVACERAREWSSKAAGRGEAFDAGVGGGYTRPWAIEFPSMRRHIKFRGPTLGALAFVCRAMDCS
jgi:hypothetical protein